MPDYTILLIDYDPRSIERLRSALLKEGLRVELAKDGLAGIKRFHELKPDLTLIEAMIPKKHGFEVCQELKRTPHGQASAVLIITSVYKGRKYRSQAMHIYRCDEYLEKPISDETLVSAVKRHLPQRPTGPEAPSEEPAASSTRAAPRDGSSLDNPLRDLSDAEVIDHLDALLPGDTARSPENAVAASGPTRGRADVSASEQAARPTAEGAGNVVRFDLDRVRARTAADPEVSGADRSAPAGHRFSGGPQPALAPTPAHVERPIAPSMAQPRSDLADSSAPSAGPAARTDSRGRLYFWIALVLAAVLVGVLAMVVF